jgi:hypothetical protein
MAQVKSLVDSILIGFYVWVWFNGRAYRGCITGVSATRVAVQFTTESGETRTRWFSVKPKVREVRYSPDSSAWIQLVGGLRVFATGTLMTPDGRPRGRTSAPNAIACREVFAAEDGAAEDGEDFIAWIRKG